MSLEMIIIKGFDMAKEKFSSDYEGDGRSFTAFVKIVLKRKNHLFLY